MLTPFTKKINEKIGNSQTKVLSNPVAAAIQWKRDVQYLRGDISTKKYLASTAYTTNKSFQGASAIKRGATPSPIPTPMSIQARDTAINDLSNTIATNEDTTSDIVGNYVPEQFGGGLEGWGKLDLKTLALLGGAGLVLGMLFARGRK